MAPAVCNNYKIVDDTCLIKIFTKSEDIIQHRKILRNFSGSNDHASRAASSFDHASADAAFELGPENAS